MCWLVGQEIGCHLSDHFHAESLVHEIHAILPDGKPHFDFDIADECICNAPPDRAIQERLGIPPSQLSILDQSI